MSEVNRHGQRLTRKLPTKWQKQKETQTCTVNTKQGRLTRNRATKSGGVKQEKCNSTQVGQQNVNMFIWPSLARII